MKSDSIQNFGHAGALLYLFFVVKIGEDELPEVNGLNGDATDGGNERPDWCETPVRRAPNAEVGLKNAFVFTMDSLLKLIAFPAGAVSISCFLDDEIDAAAVEATRVQHYLRR